VYDAFTAAHGPISLPANQRLLKDDPDLPFMLALERYDDDSKTATKTAIFRDRVIGVVEPPQSADSAKDAMLISLNESGQLNWGRMSHLTGQTEAELQEELAEVLFMNPGRRLGNRRRLPVGQCAAKAEGRRSCRRD